MRLATASLCVSEHNSVVTELSAQLPIFGLANLLSLMASEEPMDISAVVPADEAAPKAPDSSKPTKKSTHELPW